MTLPSWTQVLVWFSVLLLMSVVVLGTYLDVPADSWLGTTFLLAVNLWAISALPVKDEV